MMYMFTHSHTFSSFSINCSYVKKLISKYRFNEWTTEYGNSVVTVVTTIHVYCCHAMWLVNSLLFTIVNKMYCDMDNNLDSGTCE